uniref:Predicted gene 13199 n=1 Tax=Mus spicilegus TaxID=10103 RepID=A0A8C6HFI1_MUSSI
MVNFPPLLFFPKSSGQTHSSLIWRVSLASLLQRSPLSAFQLIGQMMRCSLSVSGPSGSLTCWKLQAVAAHRGPELLHQDDALMVQGSLQHRYDRHGCQKETQLGNPVHRKPVTNSTLEGSVSKSL